MRQGINPHGRLRPFSRIVLRRTGNNLRKRQRETMREYSPTILKLPNYSDDRHVSLSVDGARSRSLSICPCDSIIRKFVRGVRSILDLAYTYTSLLSRRS